MWLLLSECKEGFLEREGSFDKSFVHSPIISKKWPVYSLKMHRFSKKVYTCIMKIAILHHANVPNIPTKIIVNIGFFCVCWCKTIYWYLYMKMQIFNLFLFKIACSFCGFFFLFQMILSLTKHLVNMILKLIWSNYDSNLITYLSTQSN